MSWPTTAVKRRNPAPADAAPSPGPAGAPPSVAELQAALAALPASPPAHRHALRHRLMDALQSDPPAVRALAAEGLGRVGDDRAIPLLIAALKDSPAGSMERRARPHTLSLHAPRAADCLHLR